MSDSLPPMPTHAHPCPARVAQPLPPMPPPKGQGAGARVRARRTHAPGHGFKQTFKKWACPKCAQRYDGPIAVSAVVCPQPYHGTRREPVEMQPEPDQ